MDKNLEKHAQSLLRVAPAALPNTARSGRNVDMLPAASHAHLAPVAEHSGLRFPPTRAARASRGRGVFLKDGDQDTSAGRPRWIGVPVAIVSLAVAAFVLTICINAPSLVAGGPFGPNPGPAMVAAASVAPTFVLPAKLR